MFRWAPIAMVRITAFLIIGIVAAIYFPRQLPTSWLPAIIAGLLLVYFGITVIQRKQQFAIPLGFIGLLAVGLLGYQLVSIRTAAMHPAHFMHSSDAIHYYVAVVRSVPIEKNRSWKVEADIKAIKSDKWKRSEGKVLLYVAKDSISLSWKFGDQIMVRGAPVQLSGPSNPGEFDYKRFLSFQNIYHQQFVRLNQVQWLSAAERKGFIFYSHQLRAWATAQIGVYVHDLQARAIASALVLGV